MAIKFRFACHLITWGGEPSQNPEKVIKEVPIDFIPRGKGKAKGTKLKAIVRSVEDIFRLWWRWVVLGKRGKIKKGNILIVND